MIFLVLRCPEGNDICTDKTHDKYTHTHMLLSKYESTRTQTPHSTYIALHNHLCHDAHIKTHTSTLTHVDFALTLSLSLCIHPHTHKRISRLTC